MAALAPLPSAHASARPKPHQPLRPHATVATLASRDPTALIAGLHSLPPGTDLAEVRLDALWPAVPDAERATDDLLALTEAAAAANVHLIATLRPRRTGGAFEGPEDVRLSLLQAAVRAGFSHVDLELDDADMPGRVGAFRPHGDIVLSRHLHGPAPCRSDGLNPLLAMQDLGPQYDKLAFTASAFPDLLRALELIRAHHLRGGRPAVSTLQHGGAPLRALAPLAGNRATYGHAPGLPPAVPGQPSLADVQTIWSHWGLTRDDLDHCARGDGHWLAVVGMPVLHSRSPALHNAWLRAAGRPERFGALEVPASASALRLAFHAAGRIGLVGASITAPHKTDAARIATCDEVASAVGAANAVRLHEDGRVEGTNTDATALARLLKPSVAKGDSALVLGTGGAGRAAIWALKSLGLHVVAAGRDEAKSASVHALGASFLPWAQRVEAPFDVVVHATPLGSAQDPGGAMGAGANAPLPRQAFEPERVFVELAYGAAPTHLESQARQAGCTVIGAHDVLREQARDAYRFWFGQAPSEA